MKTQGCDRLAAGDFKPSYSSFFAILPPLFFFFLIEGEGMGGNLSGKGSWNGYEMTAAF